MWYHLMVCWSGKRAVMCWNAMLVSGEFIFNCGLVENLKILLIKYYEFVLMEKCRKKEETNWLKWNTNWKRMNSITPLQLFTDEERRQKLIISWRGLSWLNIKNCVEGRGETSFRETHGVISFGVEFFTNPVAEIFVYSFKDSDNRLLYFLTSLNYLIIRCLKSNKN